MKVCVLGLGAVGGLIAHRLAEGGVAVSALARGATLAALRRRGLVVRESPGDSGRAVPLPASDRAAELGAQDVVLLTVKTTALPSVPASIAPLLGPDTTVVSMMNGVPWWFFHGLAAPWRDLRLDATDPGGALARAIPPERVIGAVTHLSSSVPEPGVVQLARFDRLIVGEPGGASTARLEAVAAMLRAGGMRVDVTPRIELEVWLKLWGNMTMNPLSALTGATLDVLLDDPLVRRFASDAMLEARAIGERLGLQIAMTPEERHVVTRRIGAVRTSMLQDVEANRPIELDALIGAVSEMGRRVGLDTPNVDALLGVARVFARGRGLLA